MVLAKDLSHFLSDEARSRDPSPLKEAFIHVSKPGMTSLGGGLPAPDLFPFDDLTVRGPRPPFPDGVNADILKLTEPISVKILKDSKELPEDIPLRESLQYGASDGNIHLRNFVKEHMSRIHKIPYEDWDVILNAGNSYGWDAILRTFTNRGDTVLVEEFAFSSALETIKANGLNSERVHMDLEGIVPEALAAQLDKWVGPKPKLLYTVPTGQNPTGSSLDASRREAIYKIAQKHDILIVEDEPYYYLQMNEYKRTRQAEPKLTVEQLLKSLVPSFLTYDVDGRVIRLDSFSKVIAPGSRLGWTVCQSRFRERLLRLYETSLQAPSGFSQSIVNGLLQRWGQEGYFEWLVQLREHYTEKRDIACDTIYSEFPEGTYDLNAPVAGMFFWIKIDARKHKRFEELGKDAIAVETAMYEKGIEKNVLMIPGHWFVARENTVNPQTPLPQSEDDKYAVFFRGTFAGVPDDKLRLGLKIWGEVMREELI